MGAGSKTTCSVPVGTGFGSKQNGFCVKSNGGDQNSGVVKLDSTNCNTEACHQACLKKCALFMQSSPVRTLLQVLQATGSSMADVPELDVAIRRP